MNINKADFKDSVSFLWVAVLFFLVTVDVAFPFVMFIMKMIFYIISFIMLVIGIKAMIKSLFSKKNESESEISINNMQDK